MKIKKILSLLFVVYFGAGCATLFKGSKSSVQFNATPANAKVYVDGNLRGNAPLTLKLESNREYHIRFEKEGFESVDYHIGKEIGAGWIILDVLAGGVPVIVDALTGAWYKLDTENINVSLEKK